MRSSAGISRASLWDSITTMAGVAAPTIAKGVLIRRPRMVAMAERFNLDDAAVRRMQKLRARYGEDPLLLRSPGGARVVLLRGEDVKRVLQGTPEPFAARTDEKYAALAHFEPKVALVSHGPKRADRRRFSERVLELGTTVHGMGDRFADVVNEEVDTLLDEADRAGKLGWPVFFKGWYRIVRRIVLGSGARDDHELTDMLATLRAHGNWTFFHPRDDRLRRRFHERLDFHLGRVEPGSLAAVIDGVPRTPDTAPSHQVAQWLFAFDPAGMATFRALGLLSTHHDQRERAMAEVRARESLAYPFLRATLLEALRLWPTTPAILRQTTREVEWESGRLPADATIMIYAPFFHRDDERQPFAHRFDPDLWLGTEQEKTWPLIPFSSGPGLCPARDFVPLVCSLALARMLDTRRYALRTAHGLDAGSPLPGTLDNYRMEFDLALPAKRAA